MSTDLGLEADLLPGRLLDMDINLEESGCRHQRRARGQTLKATIAVRTLPLMNTKL